MGSPNFGPAQGLYDMARGLYDKAHKAGEYMHMLPVPQIQPQATPDPAWHSQMVNQANQSFQPKPDVTQMQKPLPKGK